MAFGIRNFCDVPRGLKFGYVAKLEQVVEFTSMINSSPEGPSSQKIAVCWGRMYSNSLSKRSSSDLKLSLAWWTAVLDYLSLKNGPVPDCIKRLMIWAQRSPSCRLFHFAAPTTHSSSNVSQTCAITNGVRTGAMVES
jgi:hypothetical protein